MERQSVDSSNIASIGYDAATQTLEVEFKNGGLYEYVGVPGNVYTDLMNASSHGSFLYHNIRNVYEFHKLT